MTGAPERPARPGRRRGAGPARGHRPAGDEDRYRRYVESDTYRDERVEKARVIARLCGDELSAARRVADLGSGTGIVKEALESMTGKYIAGFELDRSFIEVEEGMIVADVTRLPVADGGLDFAVVNHLYEHVEDQPALFRELARVLDPRGSAYVSAGSRWALIEPHYRLPFLSWLPRPLADRYLRWTGRGEAYRGIRFRGHGPLVRMMRRAGLRVEDRTREALDRLLADTWGEGWARLWRLVRLLPGAVVEGLLRILSPQWFFRVRPGTGAGKGAVSADDGADRRGAGAGGGARP